VERGNVSKIAALAAALVTVTSLVVGSTLYAGMAKELREREFEFLTHQLSLGVQAFDNRIDLMRRQVLAVSQTPPTMGITRAAEAGGIDPLDGSTEQAWKNRLAHIFSALLRANGDLVQARYLDTSGREVVRVDRTAAGVVRVAEASLQDKGARSYFKASAALGDGQVYVSDISLNEEFGAIALPELPVMRFGAGVHRLDGSVSGVVVLNLDAQWMFDDFRKVTPPQGELTIAKNDGNYILHPETALTFGFQRHHDHRLQTDWPELEARMRDNAGAFSVVVPRPSGDVAAVALATGHEGEASGQRRFAVLTVPAETALAASDALRIRAVAVTVGMALIGAIAAWLVTSGLSRRLQRLRAAAEDVTRKPLDEIDWPDAGMDEVGRVVQAFRTTAALLGDSQLALREERDKLEVVLDGAFNGIVSIDARGLIEHANRAALTMFGHAPEDMLGRNVAMLMPNPYSARHDGHIARLIQDGVPGVIDMPREVTGLRKDGASFPLRILMTMQRRGDSVVFIGQLEDLSEELRVDRMKREFVSTVSHELRTPLAAIKGALGLLEGGVMGELPAAMRDLVSMASNNSDRLVRLINEILDIEKIEAGEMSFERENIDVAALLHEACQENAALAESRGVNLTVAPILCAGAVHADSHRLRQVLANFISNGVKFSAPGDDVELGADMVAGRMRIWVSDQGPGVPEAFRNQIFDKFSQADASDAREKGGTGLGLNISRAIVEGHGGVIGFDSVPGQGAKFYFDLAPVAADAPTDAELRAKATRGTALLFGARTSDLDRIAALIEDMGFATVLSDNVEDACAKVESERFAAMIIEANDGACPDLASILDGPCTARGLPVLVLTADGAEDQAGGKAFRVVERFGGEASPGRLRGLVEGLSGARREPLRILHVEDDADQLDITARALRDLGSIDWAWTCAEGARMLGERDYDLVILDLRMPDGRSEKLLPAIRARGGQAIPVVIYSAEEAPAYLLEQVDLAMVKSKLSVMDLRDQISRLLELGPVGAERDEGDEHAA
jgi:PAS domain S-box-containing protein